MGLATAWETSADGKVWTFTITDKSKWQDGEPLTASDVAFTFNYCIDNELGMFIDYVKFIDKVEAPDDTHVVFTCSKPKANMLGLWIPILPEHIWSKVDPKEVETKFQNDPPIIGSGPFQTVEWKKGEYVRMVANKDYWRGAPKVDEVIYQTYQNSDTMAQDLKTGAIQSAWNIPSAQFDPLNNEPDLEAIRAVTIGFDQLGFNCADQKKFPKSTGHPVLQDPAFRTALQWAVDKDKIVSIGYSGNAAAADTILTRDFYPPDADFHLTPEDPYTFDLEKAKAALDAAGYTDGDGNGIREYEGKDITLRLYARTESTESQNCGKLITGWFEDVGLDIDYEVIDDGALGDKQYAYDGDEFAPDFDLFIWGWGGDVDPNFILSMHDHRTRSRAGATATGPTRSTTSCSSTSRRRSTCRSASRSSTGCSRSSTTNRRTSRSCTPRTSSQPTRARGPAGCAPTTTRARGGTTRSRTPTSRCIPAAPRPPRADGGSSTGLIVGIVVAAVAVILIVVLLLRRRAGRVETEV